MAKLDPSRPMSIWDLCYLHNAEYARDKLVELQQKFDDLEGLGVFV